MAIVNNDMWELKSIYMSLQNEHETFITVGSSVFFVIAVARWLLCYGNTCCEYTGSGLPEGSFSSASSNTNYVQLLTTSSPTLQTYGYYSSPSSDTTQPSKISSDQGSSVISPSPAADIISATPATPSVTPLPSPVPETTTAPESTPKAENTKSTELVYPINSFKNDSVLCLTFDDGGNKKSVQKALDVLEQYDENVLSLWSENIC